MKAAVITRPRTLELQDLPPPKAGAGQVRIRVGATGVCGTDLHLFDGHFHAQLPLVPGHEIAGVIDQVGPGVRDLEEGQLVALDPVIACGQCWACRRGQRQHCLHFQALGVTRAGGFAQYVVAPAGNAYAVKNLSAAEAAFAEPLGCVVWGLLRLRPEPGSNALVFGAGPIGLLLMQALLAAGVAAVTVVDPVPERLALARSLGAWRTVQSGPKLSEELRDLEPHGFDVVAEATGVPSVVEAMPQYAAVGGKILIFGVAPEEATVRISPYDLFQRDLSVLGSFSLNGTVPQALAWLETGRVQVKPLISHQLSLEQLGLALEYKEHPGMEGALKVLIVPE
ncbi:MULTISPECIES: zinc-dependent alcohol dehydrogenase family protein [unclassified Meiothermus]|uniref:zinc-dependent alcohol dehydrogenase family protein n=1 Tax=unclassified Meiothermus TaxID=370471 RepID=UPI000D7CFEFA|nr:MULTISPECIES: zinc-dependent alcohol dehydrogenase family protein [unclassified Meiothermus]PZA06119.1 alcohol dehydrogenase [Meiothermus sp. Pnk-1]RYM35393.1 alcohol dehydrogenase [Meiothermus sp. PNK-Is4]